MLLPFFYNFAISIVWLNPATDLNFNPIQNQGFQNEIGKTYNRFPPRAQSIVSESIWKSSLHSTSLTIKFVTDSSKLQIQYELEEMNIYPMMTTLGTSGIELYGFDCDGTVHFFSGEYTYGEKISVNFDGFNKSVTYTYFLTLPSFSAIKPSSLLIGYDNNCYFSVIHSELERPIVVLGSSIAQGSSANRPGLTWVNWLSRELLMPVRNYGFEGEDILDGNVIDLIIEDEAVAYILDCQAGFIRADVNDIVKKTTDAYKKIRNKWPETPIVLIEFGGFSNEMFISEYINYSDNMKTAFKKTQETLDEYKDKNLYYISKSDLNFKGDDFSDIYHPQETGMEKQKTEIVNLLRDVLRMPFNNESIPYSTQFPVIHHRVVQFLDRHHEILESVMNLDKSKQYNAIIGDSITEYWIKKNYSSWTRIMEKNNYINLGSRGDRVENVLYRIYRDEVYSKYVKFNKIVVLIGTNNLVVNKNNNTQIVEGIRFLMRCVHEKQPQAKIIILGVYPRDKYDDRIKELNGGIEKMANEEGWQFSNPGLELLDKNTGYINNALFIDGLHPNNEGYEIVAPLIGAL
ncbi:hypothetical protein M9Y10_040286 [Tritrichomonas musculus]|uniref:SGNH hydrolase-type esterase domain-containing protein n=1 Tax=Tritrichomonas musculus TaxID=1915356 RepID=A0ABR2GQL1_9EUKA